MQIEKIGTGKWAIRKDKYLLNGIILGGNGVYVVQIGGLHKGRFTSKKKAAEFIVKFVKVAA